MPRRGGLRPRCETALGELGKAKQAGVGGRARVTAGG